MALKMCAERRCGEYAVRLGRCAAHARDRDKATHPNRKVYNSAKWRYARRHQLQASPLCADCGRIASDVDHIVPIEQGGAVWDPDNHSSLCRVCHGRKTRSEQTHAA